MGVELELAILIVTMSLGTSFFAVFEVETPGWRKLTKWLIVHGGTVGLFFAVGAGQSVGHRVETQAAAQAQRDGHFRARDEVHGA